MESHYFVNKYAYCVLFIAFIYVFMYYYGMNYMFAIKNSITSKEIKDFRKKNKLNKLELGSILNVSPRTIEGWESNDKLITGPIVMLFKMLDDYPEYIDRMRIPKMEYNLRLFYMEENQINTVIDVDILNRKIKFKNFTSNVLKRAFGQKEEVTYEEYESFLESRCMPKTRDKLKIEMYVKNIPFYDPLMIIEKTQGKIADDNYHIEIIRGKK